MSVDHLVLRRAATGSRFPPRGLEVITVCQPGAVATPSTDDERALVAVVGGGIAGLAAAWQLSQVPGGPRVVVLESSALVGGKLRVGDLDGVSVDLGAEAVLARRPEAVDLARAVGIGAHLVSPRPGGARVWSHGALRPLPTGTLMGVPSRPDGLLGLVGQQDVDAVTAEPSVTWPPLAGDVDVASFIAGRVGRGIVERLVEPLLGGVYAGRADRLSLRGTVPGLWAAAAEGRSVVTAAAAASAGAATRTPVFAGLRGGVGRLPGAVAAALAARGVDVLTGSTVRDLQRTPAGWRLVVGPTTDEQVIDAEAVVLATPAGPTSRLLVGQSPNAATHLAGIEYASVAIVSLLVPRAHAALLPGSGFLVPPVEGRFVKAATFSSSKWAWLDESDADRVVLRTSVGRHGDITDLQRDDDELVQLAVTDLAGLLGAPLRVLSSSVTRWGGGLPQYAVGHLDRVAAARAALAPGLALAGAAYDGVGIAACIASGTRAALAVATHLERAATAARQ